MNGVAAKLNDREIKARGRLHRRLALNLLRPDRMN